MSGYINVWSEFYKLVEVTVCERLLFARASVGSLHLVAAVGSLARAAARIQEIEVQHAQRGE